MNDPTNPRHYKSHPSGVECITIAEWFSFNLGNAIKYCWRADEKGNAIEDLKKAAWYIQREIEKRERKAPERPDQCDSLYIPVAAGDRKAVRCCLSKGHEHAHEAKGICWPQVPHRKELETCCSVKLKKKEDGTVDGFDTCQLLKGHSGNHSTYTVEWS